MNNFTIIIPIKEYFYMAKDMLTSKVPNFSK